VASDRTGGSWRLNLYRVDPATGTLVNLNAPVSPGFEPYGLCLYESPTTGKLYAFVNEEDSAVGHMEQWELAPDATATGGVRATRVRSWDIGSEAEGCVADDELGQLYVAEEDVGIWKYGAEPTAGTGSADRTQVDSVDLVNGKSRQDIEGLAIAYSTDGAGYLIASSQGNSSFSVYERQGSNAYLKSFRIDDVVDGSGGLAFDRVTETDGIDVTTASLGAAFPNGAFVVQDNRNNVTSTTTANQNFKLVPLQEILGVVPPPF
jgi:3-phytase